MSKKDNIKLVSINKNNINEETKELTNDELIIKSLESVIKTIKDNPGQCNNFLGFTYYDNGFVIHSPNREYSNFELVGLLEITKLGVLEDRPD
jgi:hypothetical protein